MSHLVLRDCVPCGGQRAFEPPPCADGHGFDCPELACVDCGEAVFVGLLDVAFTATRPSPERVAPAA